MRHANFNENSLEKVLKFNILAWKKFFEFEYKKFSANIFETILI